VVIDRNTNPILSLSANQVEPGASFLYSVGISSQGFCAFGSNAVYSESYVADVLTGNGTNKVAGVLGDGGEAVALDDYTLYSANSYGVVTKDLNIPVLNLNYIPGGMAVDSAQGLLYFSNNASNVIDVYSTSGTYVTTIH
jgi:hypothetical protein